MILINKYNKGFLRHNFRGGIITKKGRRNKSPSLLSVYSRTLNYAIPPEVAPQQSFSPLYVIVNTKMEYKLFLLTLSFPHLVNG
jgi:hypothetical protein